MVFITNNSWNSPNLISDGQLLIGSSTGRPVAAFLTSSSQTLSIIKSPGGINIDLFQPVSVLFGGTGRTILTTFGVLVGEGSNGVHVTAPGTSGQILIASTTGDPAFSTITSSGGSVTFTFGPNSLNIEVSASGFTFVVPWTVPYGGTGRTVLTTFGLLIGEGSNDVNVTDPGTDGQILIASTTGDPAFNSITSTGGTVVFTAGPNSLNIDVSSDFTFMNPWTVPYGGTGRTTLTTFGVLIGEGSNELNVTDPGTDGQILIASTTGDPAFSTITSTGGTVAFTVGPNSLNIDINATDFTFMIPWTVPYGGTGRTTLTTFGVLIGEGSNELNVTDPGTDGQLLIASTTGDPAFGTITSTGGTVVFTAGPNSLNIDVSSDFTFMNPWTVPYGGTGRTTLTTFGVLIGEGSNELNVTDPGTDGQILIASTTGDPAFGTITSSGGTVVFTVGPNSLNIDISATDFTFLHPWTVPYGGTGRTILTTFGVLIGEGSNNVNVTAAGTSGQILIASTTGDPQFSTITSSGGSLAFVIGPNSLNIDIQAPISVPYGGTGRTTLTTFGVLIGEGSNNVDVTAAGTDGQVLIAGTSVDPAFSTLSSSGGTIAFTAGPNSLSLDVVGGGIPWVFTDVDTDLINNTGYVATNASVSVAFTLPLTASQGTVIRINGIADGGWNIVTNPSASGQVIHFGILDSTTTNPIISTEKGDAIELLCVVTDTDWSVLSAQGNMSIS